MTNQPCEQFPQSRDNSTRRYVNKRSRGILWFVFILIVVLTAWSFWPSGEDDYGGHLESYWMESLLSSPDISQWQPPAPDVVPLLLKVLEKRRGLTGTTAYKEIWNRAPRFFRNHTAVPVDYSARRALALVVLTRLAREGSSQVPVESILRALQDTDEQVRVAAAGCLVAILLTGVEKDEERRIAELLVEAYDSNPDTPGGSSNTAVRGNIVVAMGTCRTYPSIVTPALPAHSTGTSTRDPAQRDRSRHIGITEN